MKKRIVGILLAGIMVTGMTASGGKDASAPVNEDKPSAEGTVKEEHTEEESKTEESVEDDGDDFRIGIVTGSYSQSEDDRRGAEAFRQIHEKRPDILCFAGEAYEDFSDIGEVADLVVNYDFVSSGYLIVHTAHELGCDTFVHISFPRHLDYESVSRQVAVMKAACEEFDMKFVMEEAPDPTTEVGVPGAQAYITGHVPGWIEKYGKNSAYFCTNDAHTEPLIKSLMECGGYFIEADLPSPLMGYPGALDLDLTGAGGDFEKIVPIVEEAVVAAGGEGRFGTWTDSYGYTVSAGLAEHARNVILGQSKLNDINDLAKAYGVFSSGAEWNGSEYIDADTGNRSDNIFLVYQDTYIFGNPGRYMGITDIEVPEKYFSLK